MSGADRAVWDADLAQLTRWMGENGFTANQIAHATEACADLYPALASGATTPAERRERAAAITLAVAVIV